MPLTDKDVLAALSELIDPVTQRNYVESKAVKNVKIEGDRVSLDVALGYPARGVIEKVRAQVSERLRALPGVAQASVNVHSKVVSHAVQRGVKLVPGIKNIIAVASGKGGVGKSTTAVNLALALAAEGATVGMLDADIYGPSQPLMLGITGRPTSRDGKSMEPMEGHGIQAMSVGFLIEPDTPMVWRGPMVTQALEQLLTETKWRDLDYLVVDLPPGTGDIQLTLAQKVPVTGAVIVTTPQDIALIDARKGLKMFEKVGIPIIGVVENMAIHVCSQCGHAEHIFGAGGGERMSKDHGVELLGSLPLDIRIREQADTGKPTVVSDPDGAVAMIYRDIARKVAARIARQSEDRSSVFPKIVIQNN
ncbi:MAG TPA: iron-sulfur cluster carrier protein ApbC [Usitatibacter sp.]|jgi:ATP-binding protein involved in chromosome partitioning|nr:iron-sulfur cluster carrier protein ApbC [Usitatibacter sp.]